MSTGTIDVMPESINVGGETNVMFGINNTGKVQLYNVTAKFEADSIQTEETYVGNIKPGETGNVDTMLTGVAATMDDGKIPITISYEDENGNVRTVSKELSLYVSEPLQEDFDWGMEAGNMENVDMEGGNSLKDRFLALSMPLRIVCVVVAVAAVAVMSAVVVKIVKKRKSKKQQRAEEEGIDDDEIL